MKASSSEVILNSVALKKNTCPVLNPLDRSLVSSSNEVNSSAQLLTTYRRNVTLLLRLVATAGRVMPMTTALTLARKNVSDAVNAASFVSQWVE